MRSGSHGMCCVPVQVNGHRTVVCCAVFFDLCKDALRAASSVKKTKTSRWNGALLYASVLRGRETRVVDFRSSVNRVQLLHVVLRTQFSDSASPN